MTLAIFLASVLTALVVSALCSLAESTLLSTTPASTARLLERKPAVGRIWKRFKQDVEKPIAVILIINTAAHTIGATVAGAMFERLTGDGGIIVFSLVFTFLMLQFTEILPKTLGVRFNTKLAGVLAMPLNVLVHLLNPVLRLVHAINRPFEGSPEQAQSAAVEELTALAGTARSSEVISAQQERMIRMASRLPEITVREIMTPRPRIDALRLDMPPSDVLQVMRETAYTRLPLCAHDLDHVLGMVHVKDVFNLLHDPVALRGRPMDLHNIMRRVLFVPESQPASRLLRQFQANHLHMAIVVDEFGTTQGLVTLEDVLEELVGEIEDEFDVAPSKVRRSLRDERVEVDGLISMADLCERLGTRHVEAEHTVTLNGFVTETIGRIPQEGDEVALGEFTVHVQQVRDNRVERAVLIPLQRAVTPQLH